MEEAGPGRPRAPVAKSSAPQGHQCWVEMARLWATTWLSPWPGLSWELCGHSSDATGCQLATLLTEGSQGLSSRVSVSYTGHLRVAGGVSAPTLRSQTESLSCQVFLRIPQGHALQCLQVAVLPVPLSVPPPPPEWPCVQDSFICVLVGPTIPT